MGIIKKYQDGNLVTDKERITKDKGAKTMTPNNTMGGSNTSEVVAKTSYSDSNVQNNQEKDYNQADAKSRAADRAGYTLSNSMLNTWAPVYNTKEIINKSGVVLPPNSQLVFPTQQDNETYQRTEGPTQQEKAAYQTNYNVGQAMNRNNAILSQARRNIAQGQGFTNKEPVTYKEYDRASKSYVNKTYDPGTTGDYNQYPADYTIDRNSDVYKSDDYKTLMKGLKFKQQYQYRGGYQVSQYEGGIEDKYTPNNNQNLESLILGNRLLTDHQITKSDTELTNVPKKAVLSNVNANQAPTVKGGSFKKGGKLACGCSKRSKLMKKGGCMCGGGILKHQEGGNKKPKGK